MDPIQLHPKNLKQNQLGCMKDHFIMNGGYMMIDGAFEDGIAQGGHPEFMVDGSSNGDG